MQKKDYSIEFAGISIGIHSFDFDINESLFQNYENEDIKKANIKVGLSLLKEERMMTLTFSFKGVIEVECDRCLEPLNIDINSENTLFVKFGMEYMEEDDNVIIISNRENKIDISQFIYESILLEKPMQNTHKKGECNRDMIEKINKIEEIKEDIDPRWAVLQNIKID